jgi:hypothetical protein
MQSSPWRIDGRHARLEGVELSAEIDLFDPSGGVTVTAAAGAKLADVHLFKIRLPAGGRLQATNVESFARGDDLIAIHSERPDNPFRAQIYWRLIRSIPAFDQSGVGRSIAALELILSIQTSLLDSDPALDVETKLPSTAVSQLTDNVSARFVERSGTASGIEVDPGSGVGCFQMANVGGPVSYVEMVHPADFRHSTLDAGPRCLRLSHRLFAERLEKGVILRSRLRCFFVPADCSPATIAAAYEEFAASEPPLTV